MFAVTTIVKSRDGTHTVKDGVLHRLPAELAHAGRLTEYLKRDSAGWVKDAFGYWSYARFDFEGNLIIVPGIALKGLKRKRFYGYDVEFDKQQIELYVQGIFDLEKSSFESASQDLNMLIHDLRRISNTIYNSALEAEYLLDDGRFSDVKSRIINVIASQHLLKIRTDVLDFLGNPASMVTVSDIEIFKKIDKVGRSFMPMAQSRSLELRLKGQSFSRSRGPEIFEIVPYILFDNAVKYSPKGGVVEVLFRELIDEIEISFRSLGPEIRLDEREIVFEKGARSAAARKRSVSGSGFGLFLMREIVQTHFAGRAWVEQGGSPAHYQDGDAYFDTRFVFALPRTKSTLQ